MILYIKTCRNLEVLSVQEQRTLCKKLVNPTPWSHIEFFRVDSMEKMVKRVEEAFNRLQPILSREVLGLDDPEGRGLFGVGNEN